MAAVSCLPTTALHDTMKWETVVPAAEFSIRDSCSYFEHGGYVWLSNGYQSGHVEIKDLWYSKDGLKWHEANDATPYLTWCPVQSYNGEIVAIGSKIWRSTDDGHTFTVALETPPFTVSPETTFTWRAKVFDGKLMLFAADRIWWTTDLVNWTDVTLPWPDRCNCGVVIFNGEVHIFAGNSDSPSDPAEQGGYPGKTSFNDHWKSADPLNASSWVQVTANAPWPARMWPGFCVHGDHIVMAGGYYNRGTATNLNDTWAFDGSSWRQITLTESFLNRHYPALFSLDGRLLITTGNRNPNAGITTNDVLELKVV